MCTDHDQSQNPRIIEFYLTNVGSPLSNMMSYKQLKRWNSFSFLIFSFCIFLCRCRQCRAHFFGSLGKISLYHQCDGSAPLRLQCFVKILTNVSISDISPKSQSRKTRLFQKLISKPLLTPKRCLAKISSTKKHFLEVTRCDGISCEWCFQILCFVSPVWLWWLIWWFNPYGQCSGHNKY